MPPYRPTKRWRATSRAIALKTAGRVVSSKAARLGRRAKLGQRLIAPLEARVGQPERLRRREQIAQLPQSLEQGLATFVETWGVSAAVDRPVFAFSAGWRSGSTLLQRMLMSSGDILVWGEPYDNSGYVQRLCDSFRPFAAGMAQGATFAGASTDEMAASWVANLYPRPGDLLEAHRAFFRALMADPAAAEGFPRWGFKETRLGHAEIRYLRILFPESLPVLLVRNPVDAWRSYCAGDSVWFASWPDRPIVSAADFAQMWNELASSMHKLSSEDEGVFMLRFEDLVLGGEVLDELSQFTGLRVNPSILSTNVGSRSLPQQVVPMSERRVIAAIAGDSAAKLGYDL